MYVPLLIPKDRLRLNKALDWFHTGHRDHSGFDWFKEGPRSDHPVRMALADGKLEAWALTEEGAQFAVPAELWAGLFLWPEAYDSSLVNVTINGRIVAGYLVVNADAFAAFVGASDTVAADPYTSRQPAYVPPFLAYMLELVDRFDLTEDYDFSRKTMAGWIMDNSRELPAEFKMSKNKAKLIATFLGNPRFGEGGNRSTNPIGRNADPRNSYNDVAYPKPR